MSEWGAISWIDGVEGPKRFMTVNSVTILTKGLLFFMCYHLWLSNYFTSVRIVVTSSSLFLVVTLRTNWKMSTFLLLLQKKSIPTNPFSFFKGEYVADATLKLRADPLRSGSDLILPPFTAIYLINPHLFIECYDLTVQPFINWAPSPDTQHCLPKIYQ